jgi:hypothetical protein
MHLRAGNELHFRGSHHPHRSLSIWGTSRLLGMRLHGLGRDGRHRQAQVGKIDSGFDDFQCFKEAGRVLFPMAELGRKERMELRFDSLEVPASEASHLKQQGESASAICAIFDCEQSAAKNQQEICARVPANRAGRGFAPLRKTH